MIDPENWNHVLEWKIECNQPVLDLLRYLSRSGCCAVLQPGTECLVPHVRSGSLSPCQVIQIGYFTGIDTVVWRF